MKKKEIFDLNNKSIVIVGGNGNIGRAFLNSLKDFDCKVVVVDNFNCDQNKLVTFFKCDVSNGKQVKKTFEKPIVLA